MELPTVRLISLGGLLGASAILSPMSAWAQSCPSPTLADCQNPAYFSTPCGAEEWNRHRADQHWVCKPTFDGLSATVGPTETVAEPEVMVDRDGNVYPRRTLTRTVARKAVDQSSFVERNDFALSGPPVPQLDPLIQYRMNGEAFNSCDEMVFESYRSYEEWHRSTGFLSPRQAFDEAYSGTHWLYHPSSHTSNLLDASGQPLATPSFPARPRNALELWDRNRSMPWPRVSLQHPTLDTHHQLSQALVARPDDLLEYLQQRQRELLGALGTWSRLEREALEVVARSFDRHAPKAPIPERKPQWSELWRRVGVDRVERRVAIAEALSTRFDAIARNHYRRGEWLGEGSIDPRAGGGPGDPYPGSEGGVYPGMADPEPVSPARNDGLVMPVDILDPEGAVLEDKLNPSDLFQQPLDELVGEQAIQGQLAELRGAQEFLAKQIDEIYDELAPICTGNPSPCDWAPSVLREDLEAYYRPRVQREYGVCLQTTRDDVQNLYRLLSDYPLQSRPAHWNIAYNDTLAHWRTFYANLAEYRGAVRQVLEMGQRKIRQQMNDQIMANAQGTGYTFEGSTSYEKTLGFAVAGVALRQESMNDVGFDRQAMTSNPQPAKAEPRECDPSVYNRIQATVDLKLLNGTVSDAARVEGTEEPEPPELDPLTGEPIYRSQTDTNMLFFSLQIGNDTSHLPRLAVGYTYRRELLSLFRDIIGFQPQVQVCSGVCLFIDGDIVAFVQGKVALAVDMIETVDVCRPDGQRRFDAEVGASVGFQAFIRAGVGLPGIKVGIKGSVDLIVMGVNAHYNTSFSSAAPQDHVTAYLEAYCGNDLANQVDDDGDGRPDRCQFDVIPAGYRSPSSELVATRQDFGLSGEVSALSGYFALFVEIGWSPFAIGAELDLFRWTGPHSNFSLGKSGFETEAVWGFQDFCNPLLYQDFARWIGLSGPQGALNVDCETIPEGGFTQ